jgi:tight adherence protein B
VTPFAVACGIGIGAGLLLLASSAGASLPRLGRRLPSQSVPIGRVVRTGATAVAVLALTGWPVAALGAAGFAWWASDLLAGSRSTDQAVDRTEAIAAWTEMLRDTITAAHGLESAITATVPVAPRTIQAEIEALAGRLTHQPLDTALVGLADDLDHPIGDLIVAVLVSASRSAVRDLAALLGSLAETARDEATMQLRVAAARARTHTAVRVIAGCTVLTAVGLVVFNPTYVDVYADATGQTVLALVIACWSLALWWLSAMSRFDRPERFLAAQPDTRS